MANVHKNQTGTNLFFALTKFKNELKKTLK